MNIGIVGLGLIGGSLAIDLRSQNHTILGVARRPETCTQAIERGIVDQASVHLNLLAEAELIFLCTPLSMLEPTVRQLVPYLTPETILTDVGSVKQSVVQAITPLWHNFVGGHPMAGTAESGLDAAQAHLFQGRPYVLTPTETTPTPAVERVEQVVRSLQATLYYCSPENHDRAVAWISHLPVMVSASLIAACTAESRPEILKLAQQLASSGFRDTSRVGGGNPELGVLMAQYNREAVLTSLAGYRQTLDQITDWIEAEDWSALSQRLQQNHQARPDFL
jgi:arogenate dehydrogenase (NADP+)